MYIQPVRSVERNTLKEFGGKSEFDSQLPFFQEDKKSSEVIQDNHQTYF